MPLPRFVASQLLHRVVQVYLCPFVHAAPVHAVGLTSRLVQPGFSEVGCHSKQGMSGSRFRWVGTRRVALRYVSSSPPLSTVHATFTAHGAAPLVGLHGQP